MFLGFITPGRFGEFAKALYLKNDNNILLSKGLSSVIVDRLFDLYFLFFICLIGLAYLGQFDYLANYIIISIMIFILFPLILLNKNIFNRLVLVIFKLAVFKKIKNKIGETYDNFHSGLMQLVNIKLLIPTLLTFLAYLLFFFQCYMLGLSVEINFKFLELSIIMAISNVISFLPLSISGLGTRDAILIYYFTLNGLSAEYALSYSFLIFFTFFFCGGVMGSFAYLFKPIGKII